MAARFDFTTVPRMIFGAGMLKEAGKVFRPWGRRALLVTGSNPGRADYLVKVLVDVGIDVTVFTVGHEPDLKTVNEGITAAKRSGAEMLIGFGGGSVIDTAKAVAGLVTNPGEATDYLEVVGAGKPLTVPALPWMAIPTTAGTGAEATRNAVLSVPERRVKVSLRSPFLLARVALVDPELTLELPPAITASTGMDALTQLIEAYVCNRPNPLVDPLCQAGIPRAIRALHGVWGNLVNLDARTDLAQAALWSGIALANAGLGAVHGFAGPIGGMYAVPHGTVCAALLAPVTKMNIAALRERGGVGNTNLARFGEIARWLTQDAGAEAEDAVAHLESLVAKLQIPKLSAFGIKHGDVPAIVAQAQKASSMRANPLVLTEQELAATLISAL